MGVYGGHISKTSFIWLWGHVTKISFWYFSDVSLNLFPNASKMLKKGNPNVIILVQKVVIYKQQKCKKFASNRQYFRKLCI